MVLQSQANTICVQNIQIISLLSWREAAWLMSLRIGVAQMQHLDKTLYFSYNKVQHFNKLRIQNSINIETKRTEKT